MTRITPRFLPRVRLFRPALPAQDARYFDWMSDELRGADGLPPGRVSGVRWTRLDDNVTDFEGMPGLPSKVRASALTLAHRNQWVPTQASDWHHQPTPQEQAWRDLDKAAFTARLAQIDEALETAKDEAKTELEAEKRDAQAILDQLNAGGAGYLRTAWGAMETKVSGIFWGLAAPNVPVKLTSTFALDRDRTLAFAFKRHAAPKEQAQFRWIVGFGNGFTQYAISIGDDGNSSEFWHFRNMSESARQKLLDRLETVLDFGRLTVPDRQLLLDWETEERAVRAAAKNRDRGEKTLTDAESVRVELLQKMASDLKDSKRLTASQEIEKQDLENQIFLARETFKLQEESSDLIGRRVDVSVQFLRAGYVVVRSGETEFVYENKRITGLEPPQFHFGLPEKSRLSIQSDGGKWAFVVGRALWDADGLILSQPFTSKDALDPADFTARIVGDLLEGEGTESRKPWRYGCAASAELVELRAPSGLQPGLYQLRVQLRSDGRYTPEIYYVGLHRPASLVESDGQIVWNSEDEDNLRHGKNRLIDVLVQDDKRRARLATVVVADGRNGANLPENCGGVACDVVFLDRWNGDAPVVVLKHGYVAAHEKGRVGEVSTLSGFAAVTLHGNETTLEVTSCESFLNRPMTASVPFDGMFPNDFVRLCCRDAGLPTSLWNRIPAGEAGFERIAPTRPGHYPHGKMARGTTYLQAIADVVGAHCRGAQWWSDALGLRLDRFSVRNRPELSYGTPNTGVDVASPLCLRGEFKVRQDLSDYITSATFIGAKNPKTGQRFAKTVSIPQASDHRFEDSPYHIGHDIPYVADFDDSLRSDGACEIAARDYLRKTADTPDGLAPLVGDIEIDYDPELLTGDLPRVFDVKWLVDTVEFAALNPSSAGDNAGKSRVSVQLAEDRTVLRNG